MEKKVEQALIELDYAHRTFENAKRWAPNFGYALCNSLLGILDVVEAIPISQMDFDTFWDFNLNFARLHENLSKQGLEKEAMLAGKISTDLVHKYTNSHPL